MAESGEFPQQFDGSVSEIVDRVRRGHSTERCTELRLDGKGIGDSGVSQLCTVLSHFTALEILWLLDNQITSVGVSELCNVLKLCERLSVLELGANSIDDIGANLIAKTLTDTKLERLYISYNRIGRDGICALLLSAKNSKTLKELRIERNSGVSLALEDIEEILPHCRTLQRLVLGYFETDLSEDFRHRIRTVIERCAKSLKVRLLEGEGWISGSLEFVPALFDSALFHREFLSAVQRRGGISVYRSRVSFVGDSRVGKTWTANSLRGEPNFHPQTPEECNAQRTAAAESTALQIGDVAFWDVSQMEENANEQTLESSGRRDSGPSSSHQPTASNEQSSATTTTEGRSNTRAPIEASTTAQTSTAAVTGATDGLYKLHDNVLTAQFPTGLPGINDTSRTICYLTLWDFGGQKMYHSWYQFFFAPGMVPCVVFDLPSVVPTPGQEGQDRPQMSTVNRIVDYAQQSAHFGGPGCKILLIGTQVDRVSDSVDERNRVASAAFRRIRQASPLQLRSRYHMFPSCGGDRGKVGVCTVDNGRSVMDSGVKILRNSLILQCISPDAGSRQHHGRRKRTREGNPAPGTEMRGSAVSARTLDCQVPSHWYAFELELRQSSRWKHVNFCTVRDLREYAESEERFHMSSDVEFLSMLTSMSSAGVVVLGVDIPRVEVQYPQCIPECFLSSVVIVRPQWLIEVGRLLLPHPHDDDFQYEQRLSESFPHRHDLVESIVSLWTSAVVDMRLLRSVLGGTTDLEDQTFASIVRLFEARLILCHIHSGSSRVEGGRWFVPSMVAFHAEYAKAPSTSLPNPPSAAEIEDGSMNIYFTLNFDWVPPGLPMLFVGAMFRYMENEPSFSAAKGLESVRFSMRLSGHALPVFMDLQNGAGGKMISLWTEIKRPIDGCIRTLMNHILDSVNTACGVLSVQPLLEKSREAVDRGLIVSFTVPLIRHGLTSNLASKPLEDVCCRDPGTLPDGCEKAATSLLYQECLLKHRSAFKVQKGWLGSLAPDSEEHATPGLAAEDVGMLLNRDGNAAAYRRSPMDVTAAGVVPEEVSGLHLPTGESRECEEFICNS